MIFVSRRSANMRTGTPARIYAVRNGSQRRPGVLMCGSVSAIGLQGKERERWPYLRERLRVPGHLMALMRGVLGDVEVAAVVAVRPDGAVRPLAVLTTAEEIAGEIEFPPGGEAHDGVRDAVIGDYDVQVLTTGEPDGQPLAVLATPWIEQHLLLFARTLWRRR